MNLIEAIEQLNKVAFTDDKTPLENALALNKEVFLIDNGRSRFDVIVFGDLNDFKLFNTNYSHEAGDVAIRRVGEKIQEDIVSQTTARAFRQSGDEFVILLKQSRIKKFLSKTSSFASVTFSYKKKSLETKMSFGYAVSDGKTNFSELLERAETACLTAKSKGDGMCVKWTEEVEHNALVEKRHNCRRCGSVNKCYIPKRLSPEKLKLCSFCGERF